MSLFSEKFLIDAALGMLSAFVLTVLWSFFVWANNSYVVRRGGGLLKYDAKRILLRFTFLAFFLAIVHSFRK